jgi:hypothetical protein
LTTTRRDDLEHGTNAAYVAGCVCSECLEHQRVRMATTHPEGQHPGRGVCSPTARTQVNSSQTPNTDSSRRSKPEVEIMERRQNVAMST